ncbi:MAG: hypothetical protein KA162_06250 [Xanthomonadales bacterium]|nr:hypothetical protein [Xanthomonadales bacterium]
MLDLARSTQTNSDTIHDGNTTGWAALHSITSRFDEVLELAPGPMTQGKLDRSRWARATIGILALALALIGAWQWMPDQRDLRPDDPYGATVLTPAAESTDIAPVDPTNDTDANLPEPPPPPQVEPPVRPVDAYRRRNAAQAFEHAIALPVGDPDRERVLAMLAGLCKPSRQSTAEVHFQKLVEVRLSASSDEARRAHARWFAQMQAYCSGFDWSMAHAQRLADLSAAVPQLDSGPAADSRWLFGITNAAQKDKFLQDPKVLEEIWRIALTSDSPALVEHALDLVALTESGSFGDLDGDFPLGHFGGAHRDLLTGARRVAGLVYGCRAFQHCDAGMLRTLAEIPRAELVAGQDGVERVLRDSLSPAQWRAVEIMVDRLQSGRRRVGLTPAPGG